MQSDYKRQLQVQLQKQQAVFDEQLQQLSAGWEQQLLAAQYSHAALNSARERAEQQLQEVKAACQHWQERCEHLLASQDSMSKQHSQLEEVLAKTTTQLHEAQQQLQQLEAFQLQYKTISEATRAAKRHQSQASYWRKEAEEGKQQAAALNQQVKELKGMLSAVCKVCLCSGGIWGVWEGEGVLSVGWVGVRRLAGTGHVQELVTSYVSAACARLAQGTCERSSEDGCCIIVECCSDQFTACCQ
jgi:hypothetical protein